jgi:hypothetical protein
MKKGVKSLLDSYCSDRVFILCVSTITYRVPWSLVPYDESRQTKRKGFLKDSDYQYFITLLKEVFELFRVDITACCIVPYHDIRRCRKSNI